MGEHVIEKPHPLPLSSLTEGIVAKCREQLNKPAKLKDGDKGGQSQRREAIVKVVQKLNLKEHEIEEQLKSELDTNQRKRLKTKLQVTRLQIEKGLSAIGNTT